MGHLIEWDIRRASFRAAVADLGPIKSLLMRGGLFSIPIPFIEANGIVSIVKHSHANQDDGSSNISIRCHFYWSARTSFYYRTALRWVSGKSNSTAVVFGWHCSFFLHTNHASNHEAETLGRNTVRLHIVWKSTKISHFNSLDWLNDF